MTLDSPLINLGIPLVVCLISALPLIFVQKFAEKDTELGAATDHLTTCYLLFLGLAILISIIIQGIEIMGFDNSNRAIFLCSVLLVACLDRLIDLSSIRMVIKANLNNTLHYFVTLLCSIPIIWQLLLHLVPQSISNQFKLMTGIEISLMLIMLVLGVISRPAKKTEAEEITHD